ncbi:adenine deaminase [Halalkalibacter krulwichiae]|uniref:Adenine deaminase n=2 Tax=Halalkalibacter krulwichiae TaxID=199441 RepID=A0A1X9M7R1_9BACI|nr:adenine deaminase [Halalkalibacter krulwichiae]ARK28714.1 Adenine deaminase [Halalkalibacter krulwichiae]
MIKEQLQRRLAAASKREKCDLVIKGAQIIDVFSLTLFEADVAITDGVIVGLGNYSGIKEVDAKGAYLAPTFIDGHVHIESAMVPPEEFAKVVVPRGVTTIFADPHEIANVGGLEAVTYMIEASKGLPLDVKMMAPSSVPATDFEHNGAELTAEDIEKLFDHYQSFGLAEVMDYPAVLKGEEPILSKLLASIERGKIIDGHAAGLDEVGLNAYRVAGIQNDHEAVTAEEALARLRRGMYVLMREGTAAKDLEALLPILTPENARRCVFSTDDKHLDDLINEGSIDASIKKAIRLGVNPLQAIQMASLNAAECFGIRDKGAIAPGYEASFVFIRDLSNLEIESVFIKGEHVAQNGKMLKDIREPINPPAFLMKSVQLAPLTEKSLQLKLTNRKANIIGVTPGSIVTEHLVEEVDVLDGFFQPAVSRNQLKLVVAERHHKLGHVGVGIVKGIPIKDGAIVATVAHDSHNIVACGTDDQSIKQAIEHVATIQGGIAVVKSGKILAELSLPLAGLMSLEPFEEINNSLQKLEVALKEIGFEEDWNPFLTLSFLALPVIPSLKLTDTGLFNVEQFKHISVEQG